MDASSGEPSRSPLDGSGLDRCIRYLIHHDLKRGRSSDWRWAEGSRLLLRPELSNPHRDKLSLGEDGVGLDSLAKMSAATAVGRYFDLGRSGLDDYLLFEDTVEGWVSLVDRHLRLSGQDTEIVFETSGSTDKPSLVGKPLSELFDEVDALAPELLGNEPRRIISLVPPHHIFGFLFTVILPARAKLPVVDATYRGTDTFLRGLRPGDLVIGTSFTWKSLLSGSPEFPLGVTGITSAGELPLSSWDRLESAGMSNLVEVFGSTETGGIGWRKHGRAPFSLLPHLTRSGGAIRKTRDGMALALQDHLEWVSADSFRPNGRIDRAIKIAGVNVSLGKVRSVLCECPVVADAAVRPSGDRLKAFVVPVDSTLSQDDLLSIVNAHVFARLEPAARPVAYSFGAELPRNQMGKLTDW